MLFISGGLFGLLAAIVGPYSKNLLAPWLVIAYVLFIIAMVVGALVLGVGAVIVFVPIVPIVLLALGAAWLVRRVVQRPAHV